MTFIQKITKLRHPGVLRSFDWPTDLPGFGRYNLIYGWNGSGKTTISKLFRALGMGRKPANCDDVVFSVNGRDIRGVDFEQERFPVRVFNRDFVSDNVFPIIRKDVPPILVLGEDSIQKQNEIENFKEELTNAQNKLEIAQGRERQAEKFFDTYCIDRASAVKDRLRSSGDNPYNNYNKSNFRKRAEKMILDNDADNYRSNDNDRKVLIQKHQAMPKKKIEEIAYRIPALMAYAETVSNFLNRTVVSVTIQSLRSDAPLSSWIYQGLELHQSRDAGRCLFCEQTLPSNRLEQLEAHFNAEYKQFMDVLNAQIEKLQSELNTINTVSLSLPNSAQFYEHLIADYDDARNSLNKKLKATSDFLDLLKQRLEEKKKQVFERHTLDVHVPEIDSTVVECINEIVRRHNTECDDFNTQVAQARKQLEAAYIADNLNKFDRLKNSVAKSQSDIEKASNEVSQFRKQINRLESEIIEHRKPAKELNEDLRKYLGHSELQLAVKDTGYTIARNNAPAEGLSEGEKTAIALLYFLKSLQDRRFDLNKGVVVLDDPVSSLDTNALYLAFGFIQERVQEAKQVFILTHNFAFFRHVKSWFNYIKKDTGLYMLDWKLDGNQRSSTLRQLDSLLENYESEYHYLFTQIYQEAQKENRDLAENYVLPNMARRLLEGFLAFRKPQVSGRGRLWQKLNAVEFDKAKKIRILRFLNVYSHADSVREHEHDPSLLAEASAVLKDLLELMEKEDPKHYQAMVELTEQSKAEA